MTSVRELSAAFLELFGRQGRAYRAPGRVNLIGEHTDYNDGFVMPAAIDLAVTVVAAPRADRKLRVHSLAYDAAATLDLDRPAPNGRADWGRYLLGIAVCLERAGRPLRGADLLVGGDLPAGAGLSSSAALLVAAGYALLEANGRSVDRLELARACQTAEHEFAGTRCGIMDPFASLHGRAGCAVLLDCRSLAHRRLPIPPEVRLVICDSLVRHALAGGEYNLRRADCEAGGAHLAAALPHVRALRDVTLRDLETHGRDLPPRVLARCRHVIAENARVELAAQALEAADLAGFGRLMDESHSSLRDDYQVSCPELDLLVELARGVEGTFGARLTGGGFGGCTVNLVRADRTDAFARQVADGYRRATGRSPEIRVCVPADAAGPCGAEDGSPG